MELLISLSVGIVVGSGVYLILQRSYCVSSWVRCS